jgi:hypothetical protein
MYGLLRRAVLVALFSIPSIASAGLAQVTVIPLQALRFGDLRSGGAAVVTPLDGAHRMEADLVGSGDVTLMFVLPDSLTAGDQDLPLRFGPRDGRITFPRSNTVLEFDPTLPFALRIPVESGGARVWLGGTAHPSSHQAPGSYTAPITIHVLPPS